LFIHKTESALDADNETYLWTATPPPPPNYFFEGLKDSDHGVAVLTLALGGIDMLNSGLLTSDLFPGAFVIMMAGYTANQGQLALNGAAVVNTLAGTNWGRMEVDVVNMSLRFKTVGAAGNAKDSVVKNHDVLYVFAAGNDDPVGKDLGGKPDVLKSVSISLNV
jgi:Subtilase family